MRALVAGLGQRAAILTDLVGGLVVAALLLATAAALIRSTDWRPPGEADGSLIDDAEFADLDLEAAEFDELRI